MSRKKLLIFLAGTLLILSIAVSSVLVPRITAAHASYPSEGGLPSSCYTYYPVLSQGSTGAWVKLLQRTLNNRYLSHDFPNSPYNFHPYSQASTPLAVDGIFGPRTQAAVKDYQKKHGLTVDGKVGPHTWYALVQCVTSVG
jgi:murein L,D-transpeptidase YcbB/YkuD